MRLPATKPLEAQAQQSCMIPYIQSKFTRDGLKSQPYRYLVAPPLVAVPTA
jgi:hypothetical protein